MQQHGDADAHRRSMHGGEQRLAESGECAQELHGRMCAAEGWTGEKVLQVVAGTERRPFTTQQQGPYRIVRLCVGECAGQLLIHLEGDGIALLGAIEAHFTDAPGMRHEHQLTHAGSLRQRRAACNRRKDLARKPQLDGPAPPGAVRVRKSTSLSAASHTSTAQAATFWSSAARSTLSRVSSGVWWMPK